MNPKFSTIDQIRRQALLGAHLRLARGAFDWPSTNCWFFVADWARSCTGIDPAASIRGTFKNRFGILRVMRRHDAWTYAELFELLSKRAGLSLMRINPAKAVLGDIGAIETRHGQIGAICTGSRWATRAGPGPGVWWGAIKPHLIQHAWSF